MAVRRARSATRVKLALLASATLVTACVTPAEFEKVRVKVVKMERAQAATPAGQQRQRIADLATEIERLSKELRSMQGRIEVTEHHARTALQESRAARREASSGSAAVPSTDASAPQQTDGESSAAVAAYRSAYGAWRKNDYVS